MNVSKPGWLTPKLCHQFIVSVVLSELLIRLQLLAPKVDKVIIELFLSGRRIFVRVRLVCGSIDTSDELAIPEGLIEVDVVATVGISHDYRGFLERG